MMSAANQENTRRELSDVEKGRIIALLEQNLSYGQIARIMNRSRSTISSFSQRYKDRGTHENAPRSGRPRKIDEATGNAILDAVKHDPKIARQAIIDTVAPSITLRTLDAFMRTKGLKK
ncbi:hypothetical protein BDZ91DRAFT_718874 [Kalaharituber pfeilii]|nr:hypothetical protein BDZ91DRAFT_718874 [Kalaharituber pfeilii]